MSSQGGKRGLDAAALASLLARLGPDAESAGAAYEALRRALVSYFAWRGASTPEECADETLDRLAARLAEGVAVEDVPRFARGVARLVLLEHWRSADARRVPLAQSAAERPMETDTTLEHTHDCLDHCLAELAPEGRDLIVAYYVAEGRTRIDRRKRLAAERGISESALRNRAQRLRDGLERCIGECLARAAGATGDTKA
jgi:DNA-directed RNA polymerase specialized sigma24 family protein